MLVFPMMYLPAGWLFRSKPFFYNFSSRYLDEELLLMKLLRAATRGFLSFSKTLDDLEPISTFSLSSIIILMKIL